MLNKNEIDWLRSLARVQIRKTERGIANAQPHEGQAREQFDEFVSHMAERLTFQQATLATLEKMSGNEESDEIKRLKQLLKDQTHGVERTIAIIDNEKYDRVLRVARAELVDALTETQDEFGHENYL